jgi:hypothetical protein
MKVFGSLRGIVMNRLLATCIGLLAATIAFADGPRPERVPASNLSDVGYKTVAAALAALRLMKDVSFSEVRGWTIVTDEPHLTVWSFSPSADPSYPSVVKRTVTSTGTGSKVSLSVLCEARKAACANLVREFKAGTVHDTETQPERN